MAHRLMLRTCGTLLALLAVFTACTDRSAPTDVRTPAPSFDFVNNPDNGNPRILRFGSTAGFLIVDVERNLFSLQAGTSRQFGCAPADVFEVMSVQRILENPDDPLAGRIIETRLGGDVFIAVFTGPFPFANCADLMSRKIGEGTGHFVNTDNDLAPFLRDDNNHNAFGFVAQGRIETTAGEKVHYNGVAKCVWDGHDPATLKCNDRINLR